ncbi:MAG TPA: hypothetical protein VF116_01155 [Ktedonobacterales bacterium]
MQRRNRWRTALIFGLTGWLFADLFIALTMGFVANTVGYVPTPTPTNTLPPTVIPTATPLPALSLQPITLTLNVDYVGLLNSDPTAIASAQQQVHADHRLNCKLAGLVLTFGGANPDTGQALQIAKVIDTRVLPGLGGQHYVFIGTVYREFFTLGADPSTATVDVYVFNNVSSC